MKKLLVRCLVVVCAASWLAACGGEASTDSTFSCSGGGTTMSCVSNAQYCEQAADGSGTVTRVACLAVPAGCSGNPCSSCLASGTNGIITCSSIAIGANRSTTVTVRR